MTGENGVPETPDWSCQPRPCPVFQIAERMRPDDSIRRALSAEEKAAYLPPNIELGQE